jgi:D-alanine-D-alanine ligase
MKSDNTPFSGDVPVIPNGLNIAMVYDLRDDYLAQGYTYEDVAEFDSISTIDAIDEALKAIGCVTKRIGNGLALALALADGYRPDLVFSIAEGLHGRSREAQVPALLEMYGIDYAFSDPLVCALTLDKAMAKRIIASEGLRTPHFAVIHHPVEIDSVDIEFPLFVKPVAEGTGKGIDGRSCIRDPDMLAPTCLRLLDEYDQPVLVEEYLPGREFTTAIIGTGCDAFVLGTLEFTIADDAPSSDYSFDVKEQCETYVNYFSMPRGSLRHEVEVLALAAYRALQCRDTGRVDIRLDAHGRPAFIELNPLPGLHPTHSDLPMIATAEQMPYNELIQRIVASALARRESDQCRPHPSVS